MKRKHRTKKQPLPFETIEAAVGGDVAALNEVLKHFEGYIATLATRKLYDENGCQYSYIDPDLKRQIETKLIVRVLKFEIA